MSALATMRRLSAETVVKDAADWRVPREDTVCWRRSWRQLECALQMAILARIETLIDGVLYGWAWDERACERRIALAVLVDGVPMASVVADRRRRDLKLAGIGDGAHGFEWTLPLGLQDGRKHHIAIATDAQEAGSILVEAEIEVPQRAHMLHGKLERVGEGKLFGWVRDRARPDEHVRVEILIDGQLAAVTVANRFRRDLLQAGIGSGTHGFAVSLPALPPGHHVARRIAARVAVAGGYWQLGEIVIPEATSVAVAAAASSGSLPPTEPDARLLRPRATSREVALAAARHAERQRDYVMAAQVLDSALHLYRDDFDLQFLRARVAMAMSDYATAERYARRAHALRPEHIRPVVILARLASASGRNEEAAALWASVPPEDEAYRERLIKRGRALLVVGRPLEALSEFCAATRLDDTDRDALIGAADAAEAAGAMRHARRHLERYVALVPEKKTAKERLEGMRQRLAPEEGPPSPLTDPWLRTWSAPVEGTLRFGALEVTPGLTLAATGGQLHYAAAAPQRVRPGGLPVYGLWLHAEDGRAEIDFSLSRVAGEALRLGLEMVLEVDAIDLSSDVELRLLVVGTGSRILLAERLVQRPVLLPFSLRLDANELASLYADALTLRVVFGGPAQVLIRPPRSLRLHRPHTSRRVAFEGPSPTAALQALAHPAVEVTA